MEKFRATIAQVWWVVFCYAAMATPILAAPWQPEKLRIDLIDSPPAAPASTDQKAENARRAAFINTCNRLGTAMTIGQGPHGFGVFAGFACFLNGRQVSGALGKPVMGWKLTIVTNASGTALEMSNQLGARLDQLHKLTLPPATNALEVLADPDLADLIAYTFLDGMPVLTRVSLVKGQTMITGKVPRPNNKFLVRNPPENMSLFWLDVDERSKRAREVMRGAMNFVGYRLGGAAANTEQQPTNLSLPPVFRVDELGLKNLANGDLWAHAQLGPGTRFKELSDTATAAYKFLAFQEMPSDPNLLAKTDADKGKDDNAKLAAGTVWTNGMMLLYGGVSLSKDPKLLESAKILGVDWATRASPMRSTHVRFEVLPPVSADEDGDGTITKLRWSHISLATGFRFAADKWSRGILDYLHLVPRLSMWNLDFNRSRNESKTSFAIEREISFGVDFAVSALWRKTEFSVSLGSEAVGFVRRISDSVTKQVAGKSSVISIRKLQTEVTAPVLARKIGETEYHLLANGFVTIKTMGLSRDTDSGPASASINSAFGGLGLGLAW